MNDDDRLSLLIGRVVRSSAELDMTLRSVARKLISVAPRTGQLPRDEQLITGMKGTGTKQFSKVAELVERYAQPEVVSDDQILDRIVRLLPAAKSAYDQRNRVVHDPPFPIPAGEPGGATHRRLRLDIPQEPEDVSIDDLQRLDRELGLLSLLAHLLAFDLMDLRTEQVTGRRHARERAPYEEIWQRFDMRDTGETEQ